MGMYIAIEIDQPFGDDYNDLPVKGMQKDFNRSLLQLLHPMAQMPPVYSFHGYKMGSTATEVVQESNLVIQKRQCENSYCRQDNNLKNRKSRISLISLASKTSELDS